jgi:hypothetical protein
MKPSTPTFLISLLPMIRAQGTDFGIQGPNKPGPGDTPEALRISEEAGRNPNASTLNTFNLNYQTSREDYQWRVNVSSFPFPNLGTQFGNSSANYSENRRVANVQYTLNWPGEDDVFQDFLGKRNMSISFRVRIADLPARITNNFASDGTGDCKKVLGDTCVASIQRAAQDARDGFSTYLFEKMEGCNDTLNAELREGATVGGGQFSTYLLWCSTSNIKLPKN